MIFGCFAILNISISDLTCWASTVPTNFLFIIFTATSLPDSLCTPNLTSLNIPYLNNVQLSL